MSMGSRVMRPRWLGKSRLNLRTLSLLGFLWTDMNGSLKFRWVSAARVIRSAYFRGSLGTGLLSSDAKPFQIIVGRCVIANPTI